LVKINIEFLNAAKKPKRAGLEVFFDRVDIDLMFLSAQWYCQKKKRGGWILCL